MTTLSMGAQGTSVKNLQMAIDAILTLYSEQQMLPPSVQPALVNQDGIFGPNTQHALEAVQSILSVPVTGALDQKTAQALYTYTQQNGLGATSFNSTSGTFTYSPSGLGKYLLGLGPAPTQPTQTTKSAFSGFGIVLGITLVALGLRKLHVL